ncbi:response regulator [Phormidesmis priestleyi ULC007]|uniref:Response regulator n=1 Tax=Phormidesmis priestleyi ULC007 TaxID=1920490 RepID=A0A2T1DML2_9CYAN|nr:response regulator [Phormidesmis priestleyi]PSB21695.1 response regulator [Phormidesmis priestleyi ULC007]PZO50818.1 MAG: response regulator [Phormidesmis priestleyi]
MSAVLVVDDSTTVRLILAEYLESSGYAVIEAIDGIEAIKQIQTHHPDLVITDIVMPRMNGYELCRWIKSDPRTKNIPVMMCTIKDEEFDRYWGLKQGADAYIAKPYKPLEMVNAVRHLLEQA